MFSQLRRRFSGLRPRRRATGQRMRIEDLEGRSLLTAIPINFGATLISAPVAVNGKVFFAANDLTHGVQLWESDGTNAGTTRLTDGHDLLGGIYPTGLTAVGGTLFFAANDGIHGNQLWKSDGTIGGTTYVTHANDGIPNAGLYPYDLTGGGGTLYFDAVDDRDGVQLFKSDGTAAGTTMVADIPGANGYPGCYPTDLTAAGGQLFFSAIDSSHGAQLWITNGTTAGTVRADLRQRAERGHLAAVPGGDDGGHHLLRGVRPDQQVPVVVERRDDGRDGAEDLRQRDDHGDEPAVRDGGGEHGVLRGQRRGHGTQLWSFNGTTTHDADQRQRRRWWAGPERPDDGGRHAVLRGQRRGARDAVVVEQRDDGRHGDGGGHQWQYDRRRDQHHRRERDGVLRRVHAE